MPTKSIFCFALLMALEATMTIPAHAADAAEGPRTFLMDGPPMMELRDAAEQDARFAPALERLRRDADRALGAGPFSVTFKTSTPPSGDKHDYMSVGPYWWPNPDTPDGLPYVRRDGVANPLRGEDAYDSASMGRMTSSVRSLALAWHYTRHEPYAERAALLLRTWFLAPETRMNPNLNYGQAIPGRTEGRGIGIIDTMGWIYLVDSVGLIGDSGHWTKEDQRGLKQWFAEYLDWLKTSRHGQDEQHARNNHGTWYDAQVMAFALFADKPEVAREQLREWTLGRVAEHFAEDGSQPHELRRTRSWNYSVMNLRGFFFIARLAENLDFDLWNYETDEGRAIRQGLDFLLPFALGEKEWTHEQIVEMRLSAVADDLLPLAIRAYGDPRYREAYEKLEGQVRTNQGRLLFPAFLLPDGE